MTLKLGGRSGFSVVAFIAVVFLCIFTLSHISEQHYRLDFFSKVKLFSHSGHAESQASEPAPSNTSATEDGIALHHGGKAQSIENPRVDVVVARADADNTTWISERLPGWNVKVYDVENPQAQYAVPRNKGNEVMVYLTYIIDHYNQLPEISLFSHANRFQWHNDDPDYDGLAVFRRLKLSYIQDEGYVNLRCTWTLGCPVEIRPYVDESKMDENKKTSTVYRTAFQELMPGTTVPEAVGQSCCAQFAATRDVIRSRSLSEYRHMREWLLDTELENHVTGRIFEYLWHIIFGKDAVHCPNAGDCYCRLFGLCDLMCSEGGCVDRYELPKYSVLPSDWPYRGFENESRGYVEPSWE